MTTLSLFAVCAPGLEPFTANELRQLGHTAVHATEGGVDFTGQFQELHRANLRLRTASRVLVRLGEFHAAEFWELQKQSARLPWEKYLAPGQPVALRVTCHKSKLYHSEAVAERIAGAIGERLGRESKRIKVHEDDERPAAQLIVARLAHDYCTVSVDSSGELLHRRGYRLATAKAPLRETLAAAMLLASGWDRQSPLLDPFCGSGTIAIEAALIAQNIAPGRARQFAFMGWPGFDEMVWKPVVDVGAAGPSPTPRILASDRDAGAIEAARANAERAGVGECIEFRRCAVSAIEPPAGPGWIVTNPPYGVRVSEGKDLRDLYAQFGHTLRAKCAGWHFAILAASPVLQRATQLKIDDGLPLTSGGLKVRLVRGQV